jgi:hypothetical protein
MLPPPCVLPPVIGKFDGPKTTFATPRVASVRCTNSLAGLEKQWVVAMVAASVLTACAASPPTNPAVDCAALPDALQTLAQAWQDYQPDQPLSQAVNARKRLFAFQALLLSAGDVRRTPF